MKKANDLTSLANEKGLLFVMPDQNKTGEQRYQFYLNSKDTLPIFETTLDVEAFDFIEKYQKVNHIENENTLTIRIFNKDGSTRDMQQQIPLRDTYLNNINRDKYRYIIRSNNPDTPEGYICYEESNEPLS